MQFHLLAYAFSSSILGRLNISSLQHSTKALIILILAVLLLPKIWLALLEFLVRAISQLFWLSLGAVLRSLEREMQTACAFTELALRTFVEHAVLMAFPALYGGYDSPAPSPVNVNVSSVSRPMEPYPSLLMSYNTVGVTVLLYRAFRR